MELKIGLIFSWDGKERENNAEFYDVIVNPLKKYTDFDIIVVDPFKEACDIAFYSVSLERLPSPIVGNPKIIYFTGEHPSTFPQRTQLPTDYTLSFNDDSETNLFYPLWQLNYDRYRDSLPYIDKTYPKTRFCTFISSNDWLPAEGVWLRQAVFDVLSTYKQVEGCGRVRNTLGYTLPSYKTNMKDVVEFHKPYKFNLCFENNASNGDLTYLTEKILHAYAYGTVPIYWGAENVTKWFNEKSFINCNGKTFDQILEEVKRIDQDDEAYQAMLNEKPWKEDIDWKEYSAERLGKFITKIMNK